MFAMRRWTVCLTPLIFTALAVGVVPASAVPVAQPDWGSCQAWLGDTSDLPAARCATVPVPVDYSKPDGAQAQLAVIKIPATGKRVGALMINPGGPGQSAVDVVASMATSFGDNEITQHFDLVGFDPRGVGHSTPEVRCRTDAEFDAYRREPLVDYSPAGVAHIENLYRGYAQECLDKVGAEFLANVGTVNVARDMDVVRQALGESQVNYLGFSYGTQLGTVYAQAFPQNVRAMVLDGAVDPQLDAVEKSVRQMAGFQRAFDDFAAECASQTGCPLGQDPAKATDAFHSLVNPLVTHPGATLDPRGLSYQDAITGTVNSLYTPRYWDFLFNGLNALAHGTEAEELLLLADDYQGRDKNGQYTNLQDAFTAVRCVDYVSPKDSAPWVDADRRIRQVAPFMSYGQFTGFAPRDVCAFWPVPPTTAPHTATSLGPNKVVVVSTTHDPATPYQAGVDLARQLGAALITFEGTQHTAVFKGNQCIDGAVVNYLVDLTPPGDLHC
ncbi:MAG TPA: alpha/beta hydrolase [Mycobacterium sp.]|jgi:pimeloyl-ACP methyl ester carboxylesterase